MSFLSVNVIYSFIQKESGIIQFYQSIAVPFSFCIVIISII